MERKIDTAINKVYVSPLDTYDREKVSETLFPLIEAMLRDNGIEADDLKGKNVVIKPNLLAKREAEAGVTTHPSFVYSCASFFNEKCASVTVADSPGGPYNAVTLEGIYRATGMEKVCEQCGATVNRDTGYEQMGTFNIINPLVNADLVVNLNRLKTHALCEISAAVKNMFGSIPGLQKAEQHARFPKRLDFADMLCTLCLTNAPQINITDAVVGMEGNGPAGGTLRKVGAVVASANPFAADVVNAYIMGFAPQEVGTIVCAVKRELCPDSVDKLEIVGDDPKKYAAEFVRPDASAGGLLKQLPVMFGGKAIKFLEPRPTVNKKKCVGCGVCAKNCPVSTIKIENKKAHINPKACIKCYCCQEFCPEKAIKIKSNLIFKL